MVTNIVVTGGVATGAPKHNESSTKVVLFVKDCDGCQVGLQQAFKYQHTVWSRARKPVVDGRVTFRVPTRRTRGLSITVLPDWDVTGAIPNVVIRYAGRKVGSKVTAHAAASKKHAYGCWTGTRRAKVTLRVQVSAYETIGYNGNPGYGARAWLTKTHRALGPKQRAYHGSLGNQDAFFCDR
jgi:hypothetical protein